MSEAFTRESDETGEAPPRRRELELPVGALNYMTAAGARRLRDARVGELVTLGTPGSTIELEVARIAYDDEP